MIWKQLSRHPFNYIDNCNTCITLEHTPKPNVLELLTSRKSWIDEVALVIPYCGSGPIRHLDSGLICRLFRARWSPVGQRQDG